MGFLKRVGRVPVLWIEWYADRVRRVRGRNVPLWATMELACMTLTLATLAALVYFGVAGGPPGHPLRRALPVLLAGAVGYVTNLVAVAMLFRPYGPGDTHPAGLVPFWSEGLVPRNKDELADVVGRQVAERLLTPDAIVEELTALVNSALEDADLQRKLRASLGPVIREKVPAMVDNLLPEVMKFLREVASSGFSQENVARFFDEVVAPWLEAPGVTDRIADEAVNIMEANVPVLVEWVRGMADKYKETGFWQRTKMWVAELTVLDWDDVREQLRARIADPATRAKVLAEIPRLRLRIKEAAVACAEGGGVEKAKERASDFAGMLVEERLEAVLPELGHRIADSRRFWVYLSRNLLPAVRPSVESWLKAEGVAVIEKYFNVAGRVRTAILKMDVEKVHGMINEVSARHLGAIQVLGYLLGLAAGALLLLA